MNPPDPREVAVEILERLADTLHDEYAVTSPDIDRAIRTIYGAVIEGDDDLAIALLEDMPVIADFPTEALLGFLDFKQELQSLEFKSCGETRSPS